MARNKAFAPAPPVRAKPTVKFGGVSGSSEARSPVNLANSLVLMFDELSRNSKVLREGGEEQFLQFAVGQGHCRKRWVRLEGVRLSPL